MSTVAPQNHNAEDIRRLFFDPKCGGSRQAQEAVEKLFEGYRAAFKYLNSVLPLVDQYEAERDEEGLYWIKPDDMKRQIELILAHGHADEKSREKFRVAAQAMGFEIHYDSGFDRADAENDLRARLAKSLANHYACRLLTERAFERGGRQV